MSSKINIFRPAVVQYYNQSTAGEAGSQAGRLNSGQTSGKAYTFTKVKDSFNPKSFATNSALTTSRVSERGT